jgi:putative solute:sodium symporter small subunit
MADSIENPAAAPAKIARSYWFHMKRLTFILLACWFILSFGILFFARELSTISFFGWPFSFYLAAQGLTLLYVCILGIFSLCAHRIEQRKAPSGEESSQWLS